MGQFMIRRTLYALVTLFILSLTIFTVVRLTGDPVTLLAEPGARAEDLDRVRAEWGLDRSWPVQYLAFAKNVFTGQLGKSFNYEMPVSTLYFQRLPNSLELALAATMISFVIGIPAGLISAVIGTQLPGPGAIYLSQSLKFIKPVKFGDTITARVTVMEVIGERNHEQRITAARLVDR